MLYLLAVGVSAYAKPSYQLDYAAKDALDVVTTWWGQTGKLYKKVEVCLLTDEEATRAAIARARVARAAEHPAGLGRPLLRRAGVNDAPGLSFPAA